MDSRDPNWLEHLDVITVWGEASAINQTPPPTDEQLWAAMRRRQDLNLPERPDPDLLAQLRRAFSAGRWPYRIDLDALADALRERGHDAGVEQTGGGIATLYAGRLAPDRHRDPRWSAAAGPGWFEAPGFRQPFADPTDFYIGPDGDDAWAVTVSEQWTTDALADLVVAVIEEVEAQRARFEQAADTVRTAMWATFAAHDPQATPAAGDAPLAAEFTALLAGWLDDHWPGTRTVPERIAAMAASAHTTDADSQPDAEPHDARDHRDRQ